MFVCRVQCQMFNLKTPDNLTLEPFYISLIKIPPTIPLVHFVQNYTVLLAHTLKRPHNKKNVARFRFTKIVRPVDV